MGRARDRHDFVQDNHSRSRRGVVRGTHFQTGGAPRHDGQAKLVRCVRGAILDVVVDIRRGSPTFGKWESFRALRRQPATALLPRRVRARVLRGERGRRRLYRCDAYYDPATERGIAFDDPDVAIAWPGGLELTPSARDASAPLLREVADELPFEYEPAAEPAER